MLTSARLEPDAISVTQDTLIGLADTGPTVSIAFSLVLLISATAYGAMPLSPPDVLAMLTVTALAAGRPEQREQAERLLDFTLDAMSTTRSASS
jgi:hypothetical protein